MKTNSVSKNKQTNKNIFICTTKTLEISRQGQKVQIEKQSNFQKSTSQKNSKLGGTLLFLSLIYDLYDQSSSLTFYCA